MLPSDSSAAVAVLISVEAALGELLPGLGGHREVTGLAWRRLGVTWNDSGGLWLGLGVHWGSLSGRQVMTFLCHLCFVSHRKLVCIHL